MTEYAIQAENVVKKFGDFTAINNITLNVPKGSIYGFLGPNGCGKSTTIRVLTGLLSPNEGNVDVLGLEIPKQSELLRLKIGYMTQKFSLYDDLTVQENLEFIGQIFGMETKALKARINEQLSTYGLDQLRKQRVGGMSGGQKQRLSLAAATMHKPELLFLDEPRLRLTQRTDAISGSSCLISLTKVRRFWSQRTTWMKRSVAIVWLSWKLGKSAPMVSQKSSWRKWALTSSKSKRITCAS